MPPKRVVAVALVADEQRPPGVLEGGGEGPELGLAEDVPGGVAGAGEDHGAQLLGGGEGVAEGVDVEGEVVRERHQHRLVALHGGVERVVEPGRRRDEHAPGERHAQQEAERGHGARREQHVAEAEGHARHLGQLPRRHAPRHRLPAVGRVLEVEGALARRRLPKRLAHGLRWPVPGVRIGEVGEPGAPLRERALPERVEALLFFEPGFDPRQGHGRSESKRRRSTLPDAVRGKRSWSTTRTGCM